MDERTLRILVQESKITWKQYDLAWEEMSANGNATFLVSLLCWVVATLCIVTTLKPWKLK